MNDKIKSLMFEAGISVEYDTNTKQIVVLEKYTELIVNECIDQIVFNDMNNEDYYMRLRAVEDIKKHFGIGSE
jgi:hypothetical protein